MVVPDVVAGEVAVRGPGDPTVQALGRTPWLRVLPSPPIPDPIRAWNLGPGESSVLALALLDPIGEVILDDGAARRCAAALGLSSRGTLGLVILAKQRGAIPAARPVIEQLRRSGMYLSDRVMNRALALVGE